MYSLSHYTLLPLTKVTYFGLIDSTYYIWVEPWYILLVPVYSPLDLIFIGVQRPAVALTLAHKVPFPAVG